jgi:hypothetical protein
MCFYPVAVSLHTNTHITQNNTTKETNKAKNNKSAHKATQTMKEVLQPMNTA